MTRRLIYFPYKTLVPVMAAIVLLTACSSTPQRPDIRQPSALETDPAAQEPSPSIPPSRLDEDADTPPAEVAAVDRFQKGVVLNRVHPQSMRELTGQSGFQSVDMVVLKDQNMRSVDMLLYNPDQLQNLRGAVQTATNHNTNIFLWTRELSVEGSMFVFEPDAPSTAARQTAYRNLMRRVPDLDGIVLSFDDAPLPPWEAATVQSRQITSAGRIAFVVKMIQQVVVDEFGKQLIVNIPSSKPETDFVVKAIQSLRDSRIAVLTSSKPNRAVHLFQTDLPVYWLADLTGDYKQAPFYAFSQDIKTSFRAVNREDYAGVLVDVAQADDAYIWSSVNGVNWKAFVNWSPGMKWIDAFWDDWMQDTLSVMPVSDEGRMLRRMLEEGTRHSLEEDPVEKLRTVTVDADVSPETVRYLKLKLNNPDTQLLIDTAQDHFEIVEWCRRSLSQAEESLKSVMRPKIYENLISSIQILQDQTTIRHYTLQSQLGFLLWKQTKDEREALHLEAHLQKLEALLQPEQSGVASAQREKAASLLSEIRGQFPHVLLGEEPRKWNRISGIRMQQVDADEVVLYWQTDMPSHSRVFVSESPIVFNRVIHGDERNVIYHQAVVSGLTPDRQYWVKIQCINADDEVTNSGEIPILLESLSL